MKEKMEFDSRIRTKSRTSRVEGIREKGLWMLIFVRERNKKKIALKEGKQRRI